MVSINRRELLKHTSGAVVGAGVAGLAGCTGSGSDGGGDSNAVRIGAAISKSGQLAANGKAFSDGYNVMVRWLNEEQGGLEVGDEMRPVELVEYDDESNCETTVRLVEKLITEDDVDIVIGPYSSGCTYAAVPAVRKHGMIMIEGAGIADKIFDDNNEDTIWVFGTTPPASRYILGSVRYPASAGATTVGMFSDQGTFAQGLRSAAKAAAAEEGMEVLVDETVPQDAKDLSTPITKMKAADVDFAMFNTHLELSVIAQNAAKEQDFNPDLIYGGSGVSEPEYWEGIGTDALDTTFYTVWTESMETPGDPPFGMGNQLAGSVYKQYREDNAIEGQELGGWSSRRASGMQVVQIAAHAVERAGTTDNEAVRQSMQDIDTYGVAGRVKFNDVGKTQGIGFCGQVQQDDSGEPVYPIVYPDDVATGEGNFPRADWSAR